MRNLLIKEKINLWQTQIMESDWVKKHKWLVYLTQKVIMMEALKSSINLAYSKIRRKDPNYQRDNNIHFKVSPLNDNFPTSSPFKLYLQVKTYKTIHLIDCNKIFRRKWMRLHISNNQVWKVRRKFTSPQLNNEKSLI